MDVPHLTFSPLIWQFWKVLTWLIQFQHKLCRYLGSSHCCVTLSAMSEFYPVSYLSSCMVVDVILLYVFSRQIHCTWWKCKG